MKSFVYFVILFCILVFMASCNNKKDFDEKSVTQNINGLKLNSQSQDLSLFKQNCYVCHSVTSTSHDEIIAPPMIAVKRRYLMRHPERSEFIEAIVSYAKEPKEENALMRGAIRQFNIMPLQNFKINDLEQIAAYIYDNEIERPKWFESHFAKEHPNGMGRGRGLRRNKQQ